MREHTHTQFLLRFMLAFLFFDAFSYPRPGWPQDLTNKKSQKMWPFGRSSSKRIPSSFSLSLFLSLSLSLVRSLFQYFIASNLVSFMGRSAGDHRPDHRPEASDQAGVKKKQGRMECSELTFKSQIMLLIASSHTGALPSWRHFLKFWGMY